VRNENGGREERGKVVVESQEKQKRIRDDLYSVRNGPRTIDQKRAGEESGWTVGPSFLCFFFYHTACQEAQNEAKATDTDPTIEEENVRQKEAGKV
jgi:hypothetical protein